MTSKEYLKNLVERNTQPKQYARGTIEAICAENDYRDIMKMIDEVVDNTPSDLLENIFHKHGFTKPE